MLEPQHIRPTASPSSSRHVAPHTHSQLTITVALHFYILEYNLNSLKARYVSALGSVMYAMIGTRPDIAYSVWYSRLLPRTTRITAMFDFMKFVPVHWRVEHATINERVSKLSVCTKDFIPT